MIALRVVASSGALPATVVMPTSSVWRAAMTIAMASSWPGSQSRMIGSGAGEGAADDAGDISGELATVTLATMWFDGSRGDGRRRFAMPPLLRSCSPRSPAAATTRVPLAPSGSTGRRRSPTARPRRWTATRRHHPWTLRSRCLRRRSRPSPPACPDRRREPVLRGVGGLQRHGAVDRIANAFGGLARAGDRPHRSDRRRGRRSTRSVARGELAGGVGGGAQVVLTGSARSTVRASACRRDAGDGRHGRRLAELRRRGSTALRERIVVTIP